MNGHPDFHRIVQAYRDRYGVDLSHSGEDRMAHYEQGFFTKCAEYQIPDDKALGLYYKWRLGDSKEGPYDALDQNPRFGGYRIPAGTKYYHLLNSERSNNGDYIDHYPFIRAGLEQQSKYLGDGATDEFLDSEARRIASDYNLRAAGVDAYAERTPEAETEEQLSALKDRYNALSSRAMNPGDRVVPTQAPNISNSVASMAGKHGLK